MNIGLKQNHVIKEKEKRRRYDVILERVLFAFIGMAALFHLYLCLLVIRKNDEYQMLMTSGIFLCIFVLSGVIMIYHITRKRYIDFTQKIIEFLDQIEKDEPMTIQTMEDTLTGKLQHKMIRLWKMTAIAKQRNNQQKESLKQLISDISHQLKTPITNINMYYDTLLAREMPKEKQREFLTATKKQLEKLSFLVQSLIKMSRLESNMIVMHKENKMLLQTLMNALSTVLPSMEQKGLHFSIQCDESFMLPHDTKWTAEAIGNLLENAVKYTSSGGNIELSVHQMGFYTRIDIKDNGIGIQEDHLGFVFQRFYREKRVRHVDGTGLGLYLTREILEKQGGYIKVKAELDKGSVFSAYLPNNVR